MYDANKEELEVLNFWKEEGIFEKSVASRPEEKPYVFYDGPPFATGLPHYGHILSSVIKDVVPRYWTMKGYRVRRRWGWDCHGLPVEQMIEKELKISGKKNIEQGLGVEGFNGACRSKVLLYTGEWKKMVDRIGRWVEFDNAYKTMDSTYMESVWWALKHIWDKGLIYEGRKVLLYCPRCETPVSKAEIAMDNSYKDITEESLTVKCKVKDPQSHKLPDNTSFLAWTTTPWTLPGNVGLAVGEKILYAIVKKDGAHYIVAHDLVSKVFKDSKIEIISVVPGNSLKGIEYEPLFEIKGMAEMGKKSHYVMTGDFVNTDEGTGVVHTAVIYGEDDYNLGLKQDLPMLPLLDESGHFNDAAPESIRGQYFKSSEKEIKRNLEDRGLLFDRQQHTHSYPHCWRCDTQLFYNAISAWFINIQKIKDRLIELNKNIQWYPEHLKNGRFLDILETAPDWNISRNRYWATPLPFWKCEQSGEEKNKQGSGVSCDEVVCVGSLAELKKRARNFDEIFSSDKIEDIDLHKHTADRVILNCEKCGGAMKRIPEVIDCWVESGSMPFAEFHYPFENKDIFEKRFPGQYIAEYIAQTRAWFYYMHVMAVLLFDSVSYEHVVTTGTILNEKGEKLSKSKMNYTDPWMIIEQYGVDALRYYLMTSVVMQAENLFFSDKEVKDAYNKVVNMLWNVLSFYEMFEDQNAKSEKDAKDRERQAVNNVYDAWILSELQVLVKEVTKHMDNYDTVKAGRLIKAFIDDLSTWYLRRSRDRFKGSDEKDKQEALSTLRQVLLTLSKVMAPFTPFIAESIYQKITNVDKAKSSGVARSVHLEEWPEPKEDLIDVALMEDMRSLREAAALGHKIRKDTKLNTRQPLSECKVAIVYAGDPALLPQFQVILADELNVKKVEIGLIADKKSIGNIKDLQAPWVVADGQSTVLALNTELNDELKKEGLLREITRVINQMRKDQNLTIRDEIVVYYSSEDRAIKDIFEDYKEELKQLVLARSFEPGGSEELSIEGKKLMLSVKKV